MSLSVVDTSTYRHWVDLDDPVDDGTPVVFSPSRVKCAIEPSAPSTIDENHVTHLVQMRYHPQVTFNTRITFVDKQGLTHRLFVRGYQNRFMESRELALLCEEVLTP